MYLTKRSLKAAATPFIPQMTLEQSDYDKVLRWIIEILQKCDPESHEHVTLAFHALRAVGALCFDDGARSFKVSSPSTFISLIIVP